MCDACKVSGNCNCYRPEPFPSVPEFPVYPELPKFTEFAGAIKCPECGTWWRGQEHRCNIVTWTSTSTDTDITFDGKF